MYELLPPQHQRVDTDSAHTVFSSQQPGYICSSLLSQRPKTRNSAFTTNNGSLLSYFPSLDDQLCPVVLWDAFVHPEGNSVLKLTWAEYQKTLKQRCLMPKSFSPKPDSICSTVHHYEWSKQALFDFLLQVIKRGLYLCRRVIEHFSSIQFCFISYMCVSSMSANAIDRWIKVDYFPDLSGSFWTHPSKPRFCVTDPVCDEILISPGNQACGYVF